MTQLLLIDTKAPDKTERHMADTLLHGASLMTDGKRHMLGRPLFEPPVLRDVTVAMQAAHAETPGPMAPLVRFTHGTDAIGRANVSDFGLATYCYTEKTVRVWCLAELLESARLGKNTRIISSQAAPSGGRST